MKKQGNDIIISTNTFCPSYRLFLKTGAREGFSEIVEFEQCKIISIISTYKFILHGHGCCLFLKDRAVNTRWGTYRRMVLLVNVNTIC